MPAVPRRRTDHRPWITPLVTLDVRVSEGIGTIAAADRDFVKSLGRRCVMASIATVRPVAEPIARAAFDRLCEIVEDQSHVMLIARRGEKRIGFLLLLDDLPDEVTSLPQGFVAYMAVEPESRRGGVGAALLKAAEGEARRRGLSYMALMVTEENAPAREFYTRGGYLTERRLLCKPL
jgi:GNAT superfamily N-acetyltransferase